MLRHQYMRLNHIAITARSAMGAEQFSVNLAETAASEPESKCAIHALEQGITGLTFLRLKKKLALPVTELEQSHVQNATEPPVWTVKPVTVWDILRKCNVLQELKLARRYDKKVNEQAVM